MKRILIAHDLTESGARALERGLALAARDSAAVSVVHVTTRLPDTDRAVLIEELGKMVETMKRRHPTVADAVVDVVSGDRATAIAKAGEDFKADLIVAGGHGAMRMRDGLFGTIVERLIRKTGRAVLVVRNDTSRPYRRLVAAVAGEENIDEALALVSLMTSLQEVLAVHAWLPTNKGWTGADKEQRRIKELIEQQAKAGGLRDIHVHGAALRGDPMTAVMTAFEAIDADLLAITTHARSGFALAWKDSFADLMLQQTTVDLLIRALPR